MTSTEDESESGADPVEPATDDEKAVVEAAKRIARQAGTTVKVIGGKVKKMGT